MPQITWLALGYSVPVNPSKNRVYVWRKLREMGAGSFRPAVALLPKTPQHMTRFRQLAARIIDMGGEAVIAELKFCDTRDEAETVERIRSQTEQEYSEVLRDCARLMESVQKGPEALPPEARDLLKKIVRRYKQIKARDYFLVDDRGTLKSALMELAGDIGDLF